MITAPDTAARPTRSPPPRCAESAPATRVRQRRRAATTLYGVLGSALLLFLALPGWSADSAPAPPRPLAVGDPAPNFDLPGSDGKRHRLVDYAGTAVVVAWFPRAFTAGCTIECKSLAQHGDRLREFAMHYFMASVDPPAENRRFARSENADFPILSDPGKRVAAAYGVLGASGVAQRHTIYIGADGRIAAIDRSVRPASSAEDMIARLTALGVPRVRAAAATSSATAAPR